VTGYVSYSPTLVVKQLGGIQHMSKMVGLSQFSREHQARLEAFSIDQEGIRWFKRSSY
jgi:hypothetical protein